MKFLSINENMFIVIRSLVVTIIAIFILELMLSLMRSIGINILNDSLIGNILLEITILIVQCLIVRKYSNGNFLGSIGLSHDKNSVKYVFSGVFIGLIGTVLIYFVIFLMQIGFYEGTGFKFYNLKIVLFFIISMFIRAFLQVFVKKYFLEEFYLII